MTMGISSSKDRSKKNPPSRSYLQSPSYDPALIENRMKNSNLQHLPSNITENPNASTYLSLQDVEVCSLHSSRSGISTPPSRGSSQEHSRRPSPAASSRTYYQGKFKEEFSPSPSPESIDSPQTPTEGPTEYLSFARYSLPPDEHKHEQLRVLQRTMGQAEAVERQQRDNKSMVQSMKEGKQTLAERRDRRSPKVLDLASLKRG